MWHFLHGVPILDDLSVRVESEEAHRYVFFIGRPGLMRVQGEEVSLDSRIFHLAHFSSPPDKRSSA